MTQAVLLLLPLLKFINYKFKFNNLQMDSITFYSKIQNILLALIPVNPQDSDADLSNSEDDPTKDPDYLSTPSQGTAACLLHLEIKKRLFQQASHLHNQHMRRAEKLNTH